MTDDPSRAANRRLSRNLPYVQTGSLIFTALLLLPPAMQLFGMLPGSADGAPDNHITARQYFDGWGWLAVPVTLAALFTAWHAWELRRTGQPFFWAAGSVIAALAAMAVYWTQMYPILSLAAEWTAMPANFAALYSLWLSAQTSVAIGGLAAFVLTIMAIRITRTRARNGAAGGPSDPDSGPGWQGRLPD